MSRWGRCASQTKSIRQSMATGNSKWSSARQEAYRYRHTFTIRLVHLTMPITVWAKDDTTHLWHRTIRMIGRCYRVLISGAEWALYSKNLLALSMWCFIQISLRAGISSVINEKKTKERFFIERLLNTDLCVYTCD